MYAREKTDESGTGNENTGGYLLFNTWGSLRLTRNWDKSQNPCHTPSRRSIHNLGLLVTFVCSLRSHFMGKRA